MKVVAAFCLLSTVACVCGDYIYATKHIEVPVDHFSFAKNETFKLKYLVNDTYWKNGGPIFFYTGNEGSIELFAKNTGFMWEIAPLFNAYIVFAEHRYYGDSLPYGDKTFADPVHLGYLTSSQALADYVLLIAAIQDELSLKNEGARSPVIAFGGSYGGMLAAWLRLKYPGSVQGALASSAPIFQFVGLTKCSKFYEILASVYSTERNKSCVKNIKQSWKEIRQMAATSDGKTWLSNIFRLCKPLSTNDDIKKFTDWLIDVYSNLAMVNYPYPASFLAPLPAYPVMEFCNRMGNVTTGKPVLEYLANALSIYTNYTKQTKCVNINSTASDIGEYAWYYQACTEMIMPMCTKNNPMLETSEWNFEKYADSCFKKYGTRPTREDLAELEYGGKNALYTNVIFTNGLLDPWSGGGFLVSGTTAYAILLPNSAHHQELRASNPSDPPSVVEVRQRIEDIISNWIKKEKGNQPAFVRSAHRRGKWKS
ncbi:hypothetical protein Trydic_g1521 [Trypoxylus dichotomus]